MGRRKERRLAAMGATGRRVKLDLFAEPTGDSGGSSAQQEVGGDGDSKSHAEFPDSPSSSGKQPQNPLLLLEQYSDEEVDNDSKEVHQDATAEQASLGMEEQSKAATARKTGAAETNNGKDSIEEVDELLMNNTSATSQCLSEKPQKESIIEIDSNDLQNQTDKIKKSTNSAAVDEHLVGDVNSGWKMVLHEESNQYYYWNVTTGETSWEVPDVLAQQTVDTSAEKDIRDTEEIMDALMSTYQSSIPLGTTEDDFTANVHLKVNSETSNSVDSGTKKDGSNDGCGSNVIKFKEENGDANQDRTSLLGGHSIESDSAADSSLQLIKYCESLLERLDSMKGLDCNMEGQDLKLKYILEIEIRLADIKALSSYQSSLLPFWLHSEAQLKRLEAAVNCVIQQVSPASLDGFEAAQERHECIGDDAKIGSSESKALCATSESHVGDTMKKSMLEAHNDGASTMEHDLGNKSETIVTEKESELNHRPSLHSVEDVDMDVDMEVEDTSSIRSPHTGGLGAHYHVSMEPLDVQSTLSDQEPNVPGHVSVPTDEEWIPPPPPDDEPFPPLPPDDEPFPPPPPDEPPEASYLPSSFSSVQAIPYSGEYALSYPGPGLEYYVQTNPEVPGSSTLYTPSEGGQVALSHVPHYYEAGPNIYPVAPVIVNPVETTSYYGLQNGTVDPVSLMHSTAESSGAKGELASDDTGALGSLDSHPEAGSSLVLNNTFNVDKSFHSTAIAPPEAPEARRSPASSSMANGAPVASTSDTTASISSSVASAAAAAAAAAMKSQPKVSRTKKRAVAVGSTLRSNKKVSSMVDKWKAAKEELHEEDDEPKDAYEILEKKRQREIEQWHANQIASGEAKDNANFQPLGGDWREFVKRRRAQKKKESSPEVSAAADKNRQPDLIGLSKSLPSGWQAYWDDSSKQVYYGHVLTSVTSWVRPTD